MQEDLRHSSVLIFVLGIAALGDLSCADTSNAPTGVVPAVIIDTSTRMSLEPVFVLSDQKVQVSGWIELLNVVGNLTVEYGQTQAYGQKLTVVSVDPAQGENGANPFTFTIDHLLPGSTYHWRINCGSSKGVATTADSVFVLPSTVRTFTIPLSLGGTWSYQYGVSTNTPLERRIWKVVSTDGNGVWTCVETRVRTTGSTPVVIEDSTVFTIRDLQDYVQFEFPEWQGGLPHSRRIPKLFDATKDTLTFFATVTGTISGFEGATFVRGVGLVSYRGKQPHMLGTSAFLDLVGHTSAMSMGDLPGSRR